MFSRCFSPFLAALVRDGALATAALTVQRRLAIQDGYTATDARHVHICMPLFKRFEVVLFFNESLYNEHFTEYTQHSHSLPISAAPRLCRGHRYIQTPSGILQIIATPLRAAQAPSRIPLMIAAARQRKNICRRELVSVALSTQCRVGCSKSDHDRTSLRHRASPVLSADAESPTAVPEGWLQAFDFPLNECGH